MPATRRRCEVLVVGAGAAGCSTALSLAPARSVILVDRQSEIPPRIGESLHPAARRLLAELELLEAMNGQGHALCHANRAVWGSNRPVESDFLRHPEGPGWHLDRARFDRWLRDRAVARGASLMAGLGVDRMAWDGARWRIELSDRSNHHIVDADILVDASGRRSRIAERLGVRRTHGSDDRLACGWAHLKCASGHGAGITIVEATTDGWWYTAPLPDGGRVLAFHTDRDLPAARIAANYAKLPEYARTTTREVKQVLAACTDAPIIASGYTVANGSFLQRPIGEGWLAVGDAAIATDPIAARGLLQALYTGIAGARAIELHLFGNVDALEVYAAKVATLVEEYQRGWRHCYAQEMRFPCSPFWQRRQSMDSAGKPGQPFG